MSKPPLIAFAACAASAASLQTGLHAEGKGAALYFASTLSTASSVAAAQSPARWQPKLVGDDELSRRLSAIFKSGVDSGSGLAFIAGDRDPVFIHSAQFNRCELRLIGQGGVLVAAADLQQASSSKRDRLNQITFKGPVRTSDGEHYGDFVLMTRVGPQALPAAADLIGTARYQCQPKLWKEPPPGEPHAKACLKRSTTGNTFTNVCSYQLNVSERVAGWSTVLSRVKTRGTWRSSSTGDWHACKEPARATVRDFVEGGVAEWACDRSQN